MSRVDRLLEVCCKTVTALYNRNTLFSCFQKNQNNFCRLKPSQPLSTDMSRKMFAIFLFSFLSLFNMLHPQAPLKRREKSIPKALAVPFLQNENFSEADICQCSRKLCFFQSSACTDKANEIIWVVFASFSATTLTTCMQCSLQIIQKGKRL